MKKINKEILEVFEQEKEASQEKMKKLNENLKN
jgi:hypothetical protein